jgi:tight adherence protein B
VRPAALAALVSSGVPLQQAMAELAMESSRDDLIILAIEVGAPLVPTLKILEQQLTHSERAAAEIHQAQAVPQATRKLLLWLPAGTVLISQVLGLNTLHGFTEPLGLAALLAAGGLLYAGARITSGMLKRFEVAPESEVKELIALKICLGAGMGLGEIRRRLGNLGPETTALIELSERSGAALGSLIQSEIEVLNEKAISDQLTRAKKLSVSLLIPLSATTLPAFLLLTIVPMVIGIAK